MLKIPLTSDGAAAPAYPALGGKMISFLSRLSDEQIRLMAKRAAKHYETSAARGADWHDACGKTLSVLQGEMERRNITIDVVSELTLNIAAV